MHYALGLILFMCGFLQRFNTLPWKSAHSEAFTFLAVLAWGWGATRSKTAGKNWLSAPVVALLCIGGLVALQYAAGQIAFGGDAAALGLYVGLCIAALFVAQWYADDINGPLVLALTLLVTAQLSAIMALTQALGVWADSGWIVQYAGFRRPGANVGQPNHLGTLLVMGAASLIYIHQRLELSRLLTVLLSLLLLLGMGITESRTGLLSGLLLCVWWFARRRVFGQAWRWPWVAAGALALIAIMWAWPPLISAIQEAGPLQSGVTISITDSGRFNVWQQLSDAVWMKPWLGWGLRGVSVALSAVLHPPAESAPFTYAHNIVLDMAIGMGLPLTVMALSVAGVWLWRRVQNAQTMASWYAVGLLIPFGVHSLFEYPFAYAYFLVPAMLAIGMLEHNSASPAKIIVPRRIVALFFVLFGLLSIWVGVEYMQIEEDFNVARFEALNLGQTPADYEQPNILVLTQLKAMVAATRTTPRPHMSQEDMKQLRAATLRFPWVPVQSSYALSLALNDSPQEAVRQLWVMRAMHGQKVYDGIKANWTELAHTKYPQLKELALP